MSQHDLSIANQGFPAFRSDLNDALQALGSMQSGTSAPSTTYANMLWYDTTNNIVKMRNEDNDAWISLFTLDQSGDLVSALYAASVTVGDGSASAPSITNDGDTNTGVYFPAADKIALATGGTQAVIVDASQNVGIGTSSPLYTYANRVSMTINGTSQAVLALSNGSSTSTSAYMIWDGTNFSINNQNTSGYMAFGTNASTERMRIDSSGNLLVGTTSSGSGTRMSIERIGGAGNEANISFTSAGTQKWKIGNNATDSFVVYNASNTGVYLHQGSTSWISTSDARLKTVNGSIENALAAVTSLSAVKFTWKSDEENKPQVGLLAQEVREVLPEAVGEDVEGFLGVRYTEVVPLLVAAIQEQQAQISSQAAVITTLTERITALEGATQ